MKVRAKPHRLPEAAYFGPVSVSFTAYVEYRKQLFVDPKIVEIFVEALRSATVEHRSEVSVYCFMPDHLHVIIRGTEFASRPKKAMDSFKYVTGQWLAENRPQFEWQDGYHDHIIRDGESGDKLVIYIACNPLRAGLVESPLDYPFTGSLATDWKELLGNSF